MMLRSRSAEGGDARVSDAAAAQHQQAARDDANLHVHELEESDLDGTHMLT
jgi:hypothetical protein